jgi:drug/metabolite transporter (DMT)-like permease
MSPILSWTFLLLANFMWALQFTCVKLVQDQVGALFTVWAPMTLATLMLFPLVEAERRTASLPSRRRRSDILLFFILAAIGVFPGQVLMTWGTRMTTASNAAVMQLTLPLTTALFAVVLLGERMTGIRWASFAVALAGVILCSEADLKRMDLASGYLAGNLLVWAGTLGSSCYNSYGKKVLGRYSPMEMLLFTYVAMFVILTPLVAWQEPQSFARIPQFSLNTWIGLALLTFFHNYLSMVLFLKALKALDAIQTALCNYLITFFGVPVAVIWLGERLTLKGILGGALIFSSTLLITVWESRQHVRSMATQTK